MGPAVQTKKIGKSEAILEWKPLSVEEKKGFIQHYAIHYKSGSENETGNHIYAYYLFFP